MQKRNPSPVASVSFLSLCVGGFLSLNSRLVANEVGETETRLNTTTGPEKNANPKVESSARNDSGAESASPQQRLPESEDEKAAAKLELVFFQDRSRRVLPAIAFSSGGETFVVTAGPATVVPDGTPHAIDRAFLEIDGQPPVQVDYDRRSSAELIVYRAAGEHAKRSPKAAAPLAVGDSLAAISERGPKGWRVIPATVKVTALDRTADLDLRDRNFRHEFKKLVEVDRALAEGTLLFKDGKLAGITLLGDRFAGKGAKQSYVVPVDRVVEFCAKLEKEDRVEPRERLPAPAPTPGTSDGPLKTGEDERKAPAREGQRRRNERPVQASGDEIVPSGDSKQTDGDAEAATQLGTLSGQFVFDGVPPVPKDLAPSFSKIDFSKPQKVGPDGTWSGVEAFYRKYLEHGIRPATEDMSLLVDEDGGIANVVVWLANKDIGRTPPEPSEHQPVTIRFKNGNFFPRVSIVSIGQPLFAENLDPLVSNLHLRPLRNNASSVSLPVQPAAKPRRWNFARAEPQPTRFQSDVGSWASGWLFIHSNPFVAVSQSDGSFTLPNLPPGTWEFHVWHERQGFVKRWPKGVFRQTITPGENDLGTIKLSAALFSENSTEPLRANP
jgi:hypothetical protein